MMQNINAELVTRIVHKRSLEKIFCNAVKFGRFNTIKSLIDYGIDINTYRQKRMFKSGKICNLCKENHLKIVHDLLHNNEKVKKYIDLTYLHAVGTGNFKLMKFLENGKTKLRINNIESLSYLARSGNINLILKIVQKEYNESSINRIIEEASAFGQLDIIKYFSPFIGPYNTDLLLRVACLNGHLDIAEYLVACRYTDIHSQEEKPLKNACLSGNQKLVKFLLEKGATISEKSTYNQEENAFNNACRSGNYDLVKFLIKKNCYYDLKNCHTLVSACKSKNITLVRFLVYLGFSLLENPEDCLEVAAENHDINLINYLIAQGISLSKYGNKAFNKICNLGDEYIANYFLRNGFNLTSNNGKALTEAIMMRHFKLVKKLLPSGKNPDDWRIHLVEYACKMGFIDQIKFLEQNNGGIESYNNALQIACKYGHSKLVRYLIQRGADVNADDGKAMLIACQNNHLDIIKIFMKNIFKRYTPWRIIHSCIYSSVINGQGNIFKYFFNIHKLHSMIVEKNLFWFLMAKNLDGILLMLMNNVVITKNYDEIVILLSTSKKIKTLKRIFLNYSCLASTRLINLGFNHAASIGNLNALKLFYELGANINLNNREALISACQNNHIKILNFFIKHKILLQSYYYGIISAAVKGGNLKMIKILLKSGLGSLVDMVMVLYAAYNELNDYVCRYYLVQYIINLEKTGGLSPSILGKQKAQDFKKTRSLIESGSLLEASLNCTNDENFIFYLILNDVGLEDKKNSYPQDHSYKQPAINFLVNFILNAYSFNSIIYNIIKLTCVEPSNFTFDSTYDLLIQKGINKAHIMTLVLLHSLCTNNNYMQEYAVQEGADLIFLKENIQVVIKKNDGELTLNDKSELFKILESIDFYQKLKNKTSK